MRYLGFAVLGVIALAAWSRGQDAASTSRAATLPDSKHWPGFAATPLPGKDITLAEAFNRKIAFAAVVKATHDVVAMANMSQWVTQGYELVETLAGRTPPAGLRISYGYVSGSTRQVFKGEQAIWLVDEDGKGVKALADTPENRKKVLAAAEGKLPAASGPASGPASKPSEKTAERAKRLRDKIDDFSLQLQYFGQTEKPYYGLTLHVREMNVEEQKTSPFQRRVQISKDQAGKIIDYLAASGYLDSAMDATLKDIKMPPGPAYVANANVPKLELWGDLGFGQDMFKFLDGLRAVLDEKDAADNMDLLLGRLSGMRKK